MWRTCVSEHVTKKAQLSIMYCVYELEADVRTVVLRTFSSHLTPVMTQYALVTKELMSWFICALIGHHSAP